MPNVRIPYPPTVAVGGYEIPDDIAQGLGLEPGPTCCTCPITLLMTSGCKCGWIQIERTREAENAKGA
jgi:hypothetical protein